MKNVTSLLLMLVMLGVFIQSSQAIECYRCHMCTPGPYDERCHGEICVKMINRRGIYLYDLYGYWSEQVRNVLWTRKEVRATDVTAGHCKHAEI